MAAVADLQFTQGPNTDIAGRAVVGTLTDGACNITNGTNTDVASWEIELLYSPPGSAVAPAVLATAVSNTPAASFTPDVPGCYRIRERVFDAFGIRNEDIRNFGVPNFRGIILPPYQNDPLPLDVSLKADELNFSGQAFGWAGDRTVGLFEKYFETERDLFSVAVVATPFTAIAVEADVYLVDTTTIGGASVFNLPAAARNGQVFIVKDAGRSAAIFPVTVTLPGGDTFEDTTSTRVIFADGGAIMLMKLSGTAWRLLQNTNREKWIPIFGGVDSTSNTGGFDRVASLPLNVGNFPDDATFRFEAIMETTNVANAHTVQLFNLTTPGIVAGSVLSSTSLTPEFQTGFISHPGVLLSGNNVYELQHQMAAGSGPDEVTITKAHLRVFYSLTG